jgi:hypothetical protein
MVSQSIDAMCILMKTRNQIPQSVRDAEDRLSKCSFKSSLLWVQLLSFTTYFDEMPHSMAAGHTVPCGTDTIVLAAQRCSL